MMTEGELLSFRKHFWPHHFPIEARFFAFDAAEAGPTLTTRRITSPEALRAFHDEVANRESADEWRFLAYYDLNSSA